MRWLYTLFWTLLLPLVFLYLGWRALRQPDYLRHWNERLGFPPLRSNDQPVIWVHAVSVGETRASEPLVRALLEGFPSCRILLTHVTPTGREAGRALFGDQVSQAYLPYDLPWLVHGFLKRAGPRIGIVMETEIWPNLYHACRCRGTPIHLVNCRLSERSARSYARFAPLITPALNCLSGIAAQTGADAQRLNRLGAKRVNITGNLKFDVTPPADTEARADALRRLFGRRCVWLAASTRAGEERLILDAWRQLDLPDLLLVIVPRHPQRFDEVARLMREYDPALRQRSANQPATLETRLMLGDSMGEMAAYYAACDIAFVGGSLLPLGGQNLIEAAIAGKPVLIGPYTWNFEQAAELAIAAGGALRVANADELANAVRRLHNDPPARQAIGAAGRAFAGQHQGAAQRILAQLTPDLERITSRP
jgi:3-deoxy-D-manno-octulosonic-acid transferase